MNFLEISFIFILTLHISNSQNPVIQIPQGLLRGGVDTDRLGREYVYFTNVPFGKPPIGDLRFRAPVPADGWEGIREAGDGTKPTCFQFTLTGGTGSEDCLYLNIYTPELPNENLTPKAVMLHIHGGSFTQGSPDTGAKHLLTKDVVLVTTAYRLGIFGSFSIDDPELGVPGNAGMKDQALAIKWIHDNIVYFGGDPDNILVFGDSAGGASVHLQVLSTVNAGLFHKAIAQSGFALFDLMNGVRNNGILLARQLGLQTENLHEMLTVLRQISSFQISIAEQLLSITYSRISTPLVEMPSNEPAFLSEEILALIQAGNYNQIPFMIGYNNAEGLMVQIATKQITGENLVITDFTGFIPQDFEIQVGSEEETILANRIRDFYYNGSESTPEDITQAVLLYTDSIIGFPSYRSALEHTRTAQEPVYFYYFSADTLLNIFKRQEETAANFPGASHTDEMGYLMSGGQTAYVTEGSVEEQALERLLSLWTNFAKFGNPTPTDDGPVWAPMLEDASSILPRERGPPPTTFPSPPLLPPSPQGNLKASQPKSTSAL